jgi:hypothetical protein
MSTKTIYKRIALVAVAALGAGVLSVAPANAALINEAVADGTVVTKTGSLVCSATNDAGTGLSLPFISSAAGFNIVMPIGARFTMALDANDNAEFNGPIAAATLDNDGLNDVLVMSINSKGRVLVDDPGALDETFIVTAMSLGSASIVVSADGASTTPSDVTTNSLDITVVAACANASMVAANSRVFFTGTDGTAASTSSCVRRRHASVWAKCVRCLWQQELQLRQSRLLRGELFSVSGRKRRLP